MAPAMLMSCRALFVRNPTSHCRRANINTHASECASFAHISSGWTRTRLSIASSTSEPSIDSHKDVRQVFSVPCKSTSLLYKIMLWRAYYVDSYCMLMAARCDQRGPGCQPANFIHKTFRQHIIHFPGTQWCMSKPTPGASPGEVCHFCTLKPSKGSGSCTK